MYADRYAKTGIKPGALSVAIGLNGAILAALIFSSPEIVKVIDPGIDTYNVKDDPPPPPVEIKPEPKIKLKVDPKLFDPPPLERPIARDAVAPTNSGPILDTGPRGIDSGMITGTGTVSPPYDPPHVPAIVGAQPDPRFARAFQPDYPPGERRAGNEGRVTVRVLIGVDGRVKQVELVGAANDAFFAVTRKQALEKWRFKPATRDGIPQETWRTMNVTFVLNDEG